MFLLPFFLSALCLPGWFLASKMSDGVDRGSIRDIQYPFQATSSMQLLFL